MTLNGQRLNGYANTIFARVPEMGRQVTIDVSAKHANADLENRNNITLEEARNFMQAEGYNTGTLFQATTHAGRTHMEEQIDSGYLTEGTLDLAQ